MTCMTTTRRYSSIAAQVVQLQDCAYEAYLPYDLVVLHGAALRTTGCVCQLCNHATYRGPQAVYRRSTSRGSKRQQGLPP